LHTFVWRSTLDAGDDDERVVARVLHYKRCLRLTRTAAQQHTQRNSHCTERPKLPLLPACAADAAAAVA
jgi:hypothetical protein